jgi:hypothetical protein
MVWAGGTKVRAHLSHVHVRAGLPVVAHPVAGARPAGGLGEQQPLPLGGRGKASVGEEARAANDSQHFTTHAATQAARASAATSHAATRAGQTSRHSATSLPAPHPRLMATQCLMASRALWMCSVAVLLASTSRKRRLAARGGGAQACDDLFTRPAGKATTSHTVLRDPRVLVAQSLVMWFSSLSRGSKHAAAHAGSCGSRSLRAQSRMRSTAASGSSLPYTVPTVWPSSAACRGSETDMKQPPSSGLRRTLLIGML